MVEAYESGDAGYILLARRFCVGEASVKRWVRQFRAQGHLRPKAKSGGNPSDISLEELEALVSRLRDANAGEITAAYNRNRRGKNRRHASSIKRALHRAGYVVKKNGCVRWSSCALTSSTSERSSGGEFAASPHTSSSSSTSRGSTLR